MKKGSKLMRVDTDFPNKIDKLRQSWEEKIGMKTSRTDMTKVLGNFLDNLKPKDFILIKKKKSKRKKNEFKFQI